MPRRFGDPHLKQLGGRGVGEDTAVNIGSGSSRRFAGRVRGETLGQCIRRHTRGEGAGDPRPRVQAEERKRLRGVEVTPEKLVDFETFAGAGADATTDEDTT
jgi:hypothetical protein